MSRKTFWLVRVSSTAIFVLLTILTAVADDSISKDEYANRRSMLAESIGDGIIVIESSLPNTKDADVFSTIENIPFCDFYYLTGLCKGDTKKPLYLVIIPSLKETVLFTDADAELLAKIAKETGIKYVLSIDRFGEFIEEVLDNERVYIKDAKLLKTLSKGRVYRKKLRESLTNLRMVKSDAELKIMKKTAEAVSRGITNAMKQVKPGITEGDVKKIITDEINEVTGVTYHNLGMIVGSGPNSTIIHYKGDKREIEDGDVIVCDISPAYKFYAADITRTIPANGKFTEEQKKIYDLVLGAQKSAEEKLKPGITLEELHKIADNYIKENGKEHYKYSFGNKIHSLSHYVGLAVHDIGSPNVKLKPRMVITIEPGIYDKEKDIGVRIEDTYVLTEDGFERLSIGVPREIEEIERITSKN